MTTFIVFQWHLVFQYFHLINITIKKSSSDASIYKGKQKIKGDDVNSLTLNSVSLRAVLCPSYSL